MRRAALALLLLPGVATPVSAQRLSGGGIAYNVQHRVLYQGGVLEQTGVWVGAQGRARLGPVSLGLSGMTGSLSGGQDPTNPERKVRSSAVTLHVELVPWVELGAEAEAKRFDTDLGATVWRLIGANLRFASGMGLPGLAGTAEASYFPVATVTGGDKISLAFRGTLGVSYAPGRSPLWLHLGYRFERFDFEAKGELPARLEQFRGVVAGLGLRIGR